MHDELIELKSFDSNIYPLIDLISSKSYSAKNILSIFTSIPKHFLVTDYSRLYDYIFTKLGYKLKVLLADTVFLGDFNIVNYMNYFIEDSYSNHSMFYRFFSVNLSTFE